MAIELIVAHDRNRLIGANGQIPWHLPNDLRRFKALTLGHTVLMGRKTWESLPKKPLPGRDNWVVSRDPNFSAEGARVFTSMDAALASSCVGNLMVIGGSDVYRAALAVADGLHITEVDAACTGDVWFPAYEDAGFVEVERQSLPADAQHPFAYCFKRYQRLGSAAVAP